MIIYTLYNTINHLSRQEDFKLKSTTLSSNGRLLSTYKIVQITAPSITTTTTISTTERVK